MLLYQLSESIIHGAYLTYNCVILFWKATPNISEDYK